MPKKMTKKEIQSELRKDERAIAEKKVLEKSSDKVKKGEYAPDLDSKALFKGLSENKIKDILKFLISLDLSEYNEFEYIDTESSGLTGHEEKGYVRSDLIFKFWKTGDKENAVTVVIEFQTSSDETMGERLFIYTLNRSKTYIKDRKTYIEPAKSIIIYSTLDMPLQGVDTVLVRQYKYKEKGLFKFELVDTDDFYKVEYPYINILALNDKEFKEVDDGVLDIFRILFLYRYKKKHELLLEADLFENIEKAQDIAKKYTGKDFKILSEILIKLLQDIENILNFKKTSNDEYGEVLDIMQNIKSYPKLDLFHKYGIEGEARGKMETALKLANKMLLTQDIEFTADFFELPIEYVQAIHDGSTVESILEEYLAELFPPEIENKK